MDTSLQNNAQENGKLQVNIAYMYLNSGIHNRVDEEPANSYAYNTA
jgi:hypothetical protein